MKKTVINMITGAVALICFLILVAENGESMSLAALIMAKLAAAAILYVCCKVAKKVNPNSWRKNKMLPVDYRPEYDEDEEYYTEVEELVERTLEDELEEAEDAAADDWLEDQMMSRHGDR